MGTANSKIVQALSANEYLSRFIGSFKIEIEDPFWETFLSFPVRSCSNKDDDEFLFHKTKCYFYQLVVNNNQTNNLNTLVRYFIRRVKNILHFPSHEFEVSLPVIQNSLLVVRIFLQHLVHNFPESELFSHFNTEDNLPGCSPCAEKLLSKFIDTLYTVILCFPLLESTYAVHQECINNVLVLLSVQLFMDESVKDLKVYKLLFNSIHSIKIAERLSLRIIINLEDEQRGASAFFDLSKIMRYFVTVKERPDELLSRSAVILLIVLVNQYTGISNPFRETFGLLDIGFPNLYKKICSSLEQEEMTLLLYNLLHGNEKFKDFVLAQDDIDALVLPMLKAVYNANDNGCHHIYMSLIILLILTEITEFNKKVHNIVLKNIPWFVDKNVGEITLGGLIILVTTRTVKINLLKMRDEYLHTNCLAALANMSSQFSDLSPYVCERLVGLFEKLAKTYKRAQQELVAIEKALRIILEVLNSCLCNQLPNNSNLVYTLLYKRYIFEPFQENPAFQDIICNIKQVMEYFVTRLDAECQYDQGIIDVNAVHEVIEKYSSSSIINQLQKFPELKFKYIEEEKPEKFFTPYTWSIVHKSSYLFFEPVIFERNQV